MTLCQASRGGRRRLAWFVCGRQEITNGDRGIVSQSHTGLVAFLAELPDVLERGMGADDPSRQRGLDPGAVQGEPSRALPVGGDSRFMGSGLGPLDRKRLVFLRAL